MDSGGWLFPGKPWALRAKPAKFIFKLLAPPRPPVFLETCLGGPIGPGRLLMVALSVPGVYLLLHPLFTQKPYVFKGAEARGSSTLPASGA